jgi:hypothetical protein
MKKLLMTVAIAVPLALSLNAVVPGGGEALAKIRDVPTSCENQGGNQPGGQQPECTGGGLTQNSERQNPAGHAPPGQN